MSKLEHKLNNIDDSDESMELDTSEFNKVMKRLDKIDSDIESIAKAITDGDNATRQYIDNEVAKVRNDTKEDINHAVDLFADRTRVVVNDILSPIANQLSKFVERSTYNLEEIKELKVGATEHKRQLDILSQQLTIERESRLSDSTMLSTALLGDDMGVSMGMVGVVQSMSKKLDQHIERTSKYFDLQAEFNKQVEKHEKLFALIQDTNWQYVIRRALIGGITAIATGIFAYLKSHGII